VQSGGELLRVEQRVRHDILQVLAGFARRDRARGTPDLSAQVGESCGVVIDDAVAGGASEHRQEARRAGRGAAVIARWTPRPAHRGP